MSLISRLKIESFGMFVSILFYIVVGVIFVVLLPITDYPPQIGLIGIFSLIVAYGMFKKRNWTIWFDLILLFTATTFSVYMLDYYLARDYLTSLGLIAYLILTWIFALYIASKRKTLET